MIKNFFLSLFITLTSLMLAVIAGMYIPVTVDDGRGINHEPPQQRQYTAKELDDAEKRIKERIETHRQKNKDIRGVEFLVEYRKNFWGLTWVPWLFLGLFIRQKNLLDYAVLPIPPAIFTFFGLILPAEIILFILAATFGIVLNKKMSSLLGYLKKSGSK